MNKKYISVIIVSLILIGLFVGLSFINIQKASVASGWDFQCHTYTHPSLISLTADQIRTELQKVNSAFQAQGLPLPEHHAYPYGDYNAQVQSVVKDFRKSGRLISGVMETYPVANWYELKCTEIQAPTNWTTIKGWVDNCTASNGLMQIFTHKVTSPAPLYGCTPAMLTQLLDYLVQKQNAGQLLVMTMKQAYTSYDGNKAVVVVAFDDGWRTDYTTVWPLFKERGLAGTSYIYPQAMDEGWSGFLTWAMVKEMAKAP